MLEPKGRSTNKAVRSGCGLDPYTQLCDRLVKWDVLFAAVPVGPCAAC